MKDDPLGQIPPDHPWFQAVVQVVQELKGETYQSLVSPPTVGIPSAARDFDAGRCTMADDILTRLESRQREAERQRAK